LQDPDGDDDQEEAMMKEKSVRRQKQIVETVEKMLQDVLQSQGKKDE